MLFDKIIGPKPAVENIPPSGLPLTGSGNKYLLERIVKWVLFILASVSVLTTVGIVSVLLFEGVQFFTSDFYENNPTERVATSSIEGSAGEAPNALAPGIVPKVEVRATTDSLIYVNWERPAVGQEPTGYEVSVLPSLNADLSDCASLTADRTSCVIANAAPGRSHKVTVAALAGSGKGVGLQTASFSVPEKVKWHRFLTDTKWRTLLVPRSYGIWPLLVGTTMIAVLAMVVAVPLGLLSAIFLSEYAHPRLRAITKPILEVLAGIPDSGVRVFRPIFHHANLALVQRRRGHLQRAVSRHRDGSDDYPHGLQPERGRHAGGPQRAAGGRLRPGGNQG